MATSEDAAQITLDVATPHEIRITSHGKIRAWVEFALNFFKENPERPLVLHTLPAPTPETKKPRIHSAVANVPRLISVAEIIKREYLKTLSPEQSEAGKLSGLHQYNEISTFEDDNQGDPEETPEQARQRAITAALQGKRHLRQHKVAFMKVTLCRKELSNPVAQGATYQKPQIRNLSKSARTRLKRREKKEAMVQ
ncbi:hypothetical protein IEO21_02581 [Rhodonia placenta]|uniref:Uncharacterized protein n=1 Tax=Rhodonia placenta TaxID=104341 RepID=A0A8H7U498_9APHY|nr:hypothetical protein IEO21_02581 [Postia placenta]